VGNVTLEARLAKATAVGEEQRLDIAVRAADAPLARASVRVHITNSFGSSRMRAPDTDQDGRSVKVWQTYRSVGLNRVEVLVTTLDGRDLQTELSFWGMRSAPDATPTARSR
jgi:hypothetical protein